jgi:tetratricopeptide (TPR) repeat protein
LTETPATAAALARRLLDGGAALGDADVRADPLALAWALKDLCYEAWHGEPVRAARAADLLQAFSEQGLPEVVATEVAALADWTAGIACVTRGRVGEAPALFERAAAGLRAAGRPGPAAETQVPRIMALSMLGRADEAVACALAAQRELLALGNGAAAARVSQNLGSLLLFRDRYAEAAVHFREAAVLFARHRDPARSVLADIGLGNALAAMGDFDEARRIYARARMRAANQGLALQQALVDEATGLLHIARGEFRQALAGFESARRRYEALALPQHVAVAERQLGDAYLELRLRPEALALFQSAQAKFHAQGLVVEEAWALKQRGLAEALLGQPDAERALAGAAALFAHQGNAVGAAAVALARAELALGRTDASAALASAEVAMQGYEQAGQPAGRLRAEVIRARALLGLGLQAEAGAGFDAALSHARALQQLPEQVRCLTGQGLVAGAGGRLQAAAALFESAIALFEDLRAALPGEEFRNAFLADHLRPYQECLRLALRGGSAEDVLQQLDRFRARALDERLHEAVAADVEPELQALRERLNWLYRRVQRLQDEAGAWQPLDEELRQTERELLERTRRARLAGAAAQPRDGPAAGTFTLQALQAALQPGDALVEYGLLDGELFACVVTPQQVLLQRRLAAWPQVLDALQAARFQIDSLRHGLAPLRQHLPVLTRRAQVRLHSLHTLLWAPLEPALLACRRLLVVPHGLLATVPFAALIGDEQEPLGARFQLALVPSARAAVRGLQRPPVAALRALALGDSSRLLHAAGEAQFVAGLFPQGQALVGEAASLPALRAAAGAADVLHLACHAQFRSDNPRFSALHLHDGALTVDEAESLGLRACTVVLSACETGLADTRGGDEMIGLARAFLVAGASRVLASLWPVDDAVTLAFMADFYGALGSGAAPAAALQRAQAACRATHPHAYFWAPFTLFGGW